MKQFYKICLLASLIFGNYTSKIYTSFDHSKNAKQQVISTSRKQKGDPFKFTKLSTKVQKLVGEFVGINEQTRNWNSPLQEAVDSNNYDIVKFLVKLGANLNAAPAHNENIPLIMAIQNYKKEANILKCSQKENKAKSYIIFKYLLEAGADYNKANENPIKSHLTNDKNTPLHEAVDSDTIRFLQYLLNLPNIQLDVENIWGQTALDCAKLQAMNKKIKIDDRKHFYQVCALLESKNAPSSIVLEPMPTDEEMEQQHYEAHQPVYKKNSTEKYKFLI